MLVRKVEEKLMNWYSRDKKLALLITGARQIGKTFSIRSFGRANYDHFIEINFINEPKAEAIFSGNLDADTLIMNLTAYIRKPMSSGKTLIFFDEIQECPNARTAIKFLVEDGRFDYIESGSLLGVNYKEVRSYPVGYEEKLQMYPLDFEEFALANGVQKQVIDYLRNCYQNGTSVSTAVHQSMSDLFRYYVIVGGMPAVVQSFIDTHDITQVLQMQKDILNLYRQDITKYSQQDKLRIKSIFDRLPSELNAKNRRFKLADIDKSARFNRYESSFNWLIDAGVSLPCYNVTAPEIPLRINEQSNLFKLFLCDTGLLCAASMENVQFDILQGDLTVNMGSILENTFAQLLQANGFELRYMSKKIGEIDFIVQMGHQIIPIEVKSGNDCQKHKALDNAMTTKEWRIQRAIVFCKNNFSIAGAIEYYPWYMVMFLVQKQLPDQLLVDLDLSGLK